MRISLIAFGASSPIKVLLIWKDNGPHEKKQLFVSVFTTASWVKPPQPDEPISLTQTSLMGPCGDAGKAG